MNQQPPPTADAPWSPWTLLAVALLGSGLMWAALPPLDWGPLAWVAPIAWLLIVLHKPLGSARAVASPDSPKTFRRRLVRVAASSAFLLWLAGFAHWLAVVHWIRYPHPATWVGWLALSAYLGCYLPVFVGVSRIAVHGLSIPLAVAAPVVWTGLELARSHLITGFLMAALGHTQHRFLALIQVSDLAGAYGVSFIVMLVAAALAQIVARPRRWKAWLWLSAAAAVVVAAWGYGTFRLSHESFSTGPRVALIQSTIRPRWKHDPDLAQRVFEDYYELTIDAVESSERPIDLIVWPETMYRFPLCLVPGETQLPAEQATRYRQAGNAVTAHIGQLVSRVGAPMLLGLDIAELSGDEVDKFNAAIVTDGKGQIRGRYYKMHRVLFGEFVPLAEQIPILARLSPIGAGIQAGDGPLAASTHEGGVLYAPNICYETVLPQVIRRQVRELQLAGDDPDVLVNLTNDAWFRGSNEHQMHLVCSLFRAVECRKPLVIAANGGISAAIDGSGRVLGRRDSFDRDFLLADVPLDNRESWYLSIGDAPAAVCLLACALLLAWEAKCRYRARNR